jgi:hypothetical protein
MMLAVLMTAFCVYGATTNTVTITIIYPEAGDPQAIGPLNLNFSNIVAWAATQTNTTAGLQLQITTNATGVTSAQATADLALSRSAGGTVTGNVTVAGGVFSVTSSVTSIIYAEANDGALGVAETIRYDSASPAVGDVIGRKGWQGYDSGGFPSSYGYYDAGIANPTNGAESGFLSYKVHMDGTARSAMDIYGFNGTDGQGYFLINGGNSDIDFIVRDDNGAEAFKVFGSDGGVYSATIKTGDTQVISGAVAGEIWADNGEEFTLKLGQ